MSESFDILNRTLAINSHKLIEASAGTGKTFAMEHLFVRLLIETNPCTIEQILAVTFTRAAANEMKIRILSNIKQSLDFVEQSLKGQLITKSGIPDYLLKIAEEGTNSLEQSKLLLIKAIYGFDRAEIHTIHAFCHKMLLENILSCDIQLNSISEDLTPFQLKQVIRDFFRSNLVDVLSDAEIQTILKFHQGSEEKLMDALSKTLTQHGDIAGSDTYKEHQDLIRNAFYALNLSGQNLQQEFTSCCSSYKNLANKKGEVKQEVIHNIEKFSALFDKNEWNQNDYDWLVKDQLSLINQFSPENLKKKPTKIFPENLIFEIKRVLSPLLAPGILFLRLAKGCKKLYQKQIIEKEHYHFDDLLISMKRSLKNPAFLEMIQNHFQAVIVDEFQDTDPLQWDILSKLFLKNKNWKGRLFLVGDPKQSIYAFRGADLNCYLDAKDTIALNNIQSLSINYRAHKPLVDALNVLFSTAKDIFLIPERKQIIPYHPVLASQKIEEKHFQDKDGSVHFCVIDNCDTSQSYPLEKWEEDLLFPYFANKILKLNEQDQILFSQIALLVSDRFQAERLHQFLQRVKIPSINTTNNLQKSSQAIKEIKEVLLGTLFHKNENYLKRALSTRILGWNHEQILQLDDYQVCVDPLSKLSQLKNVLLKSGFSLFYQKLLNTNFQIHGETVLERLLSQENPEGFFVELNEFAENLMNYKYPLSNPEKLLDYLEELNQKKVTENLNIQPTHNQDAAIIQTIHASKGLEYDIVFCPGLITRTKKKNNLYYLHKRKFVPVIDQDSSSNRLMEAEQNAEKMRLLYVALTRAKFRVYIPALTHINAKENTPLSAIELLLQALSKGLDISGMSLYQSLETNQITSTRLHPPKTFPQKKHIKTDTLIPPVPPTLNFSPSYIQSFTSLTIKKTISYAENSPSEFDNNLKNAHTLPAGSHTGSLLHNLYETIPLKFVQTCKKSEDLISWVEEEISHTPYHSWSAAIASILYNSFHTQLSNFKLSEINPSHCFRETEFIFSQQNDCLRGIIDLLFYHNDLYYLVDWKTNWLGNNLASYSKDRLDNAMKTHQYHLQATIYTEACQKYLKIVEPRPFHEIFGGVFYLFVRGMDPNYHHSGVLFSQPHIDKIK